MKKRLIIAALGLLSLGSIMSFTGNFESSRPFWGWGDWSCSGNEYLTCCTRTHYVLWMENAYDVQCN